MQDPKASGNPGAFLTYTDRNVAAHEVLIFGTTKEKKKEKKQQNIPL